MISVLCCSTPGSANAALLEDPDLYISRDGGITWEQTLEKSWGVGVADHGGLLVAAKDFHQTEESTVLRYSCNEGYSWNNFEFSSVSPCVSVSVCVMYSMYVCTYISCIYMYWSYVLEFCFAVVGYRICFEF